VRQISGEGMLWKNALKPAHWRRVKVKRRGRPWPPGFWSL